LADVLSTGYFADKVFQLEEGDYIYIFSGDGFSIASVSADTDTLGAVVNGNKAYGVVYRNIDLASITVVSSTAIYYPCTISPNPTALDAASTSHFTTTDNGDLIYSGPSARFRWKWEGQGFVPGSNQEAVLLVPLINGVAYTAVSSRGPGDPFYNPWQSIGIIPLDNGDVIRLGIRNASNTDDVGINGYYMELSQVSN
jgi:hypothetical protein